jgi:hypothetical protein
VSVDKNKLDVLDWVVPERSMILLAEVGQTADVFDDLAPSSTRWHVYGITRRGYGTSGYVPTVNPADRLKSYFSFSIDRRRDARSTATS